ncbi:hypothetical protein BGY98DRAFT_963123 [Russula aff. rugulosa BPL654]|nr:hypothetical protein BGY98DRAFT_963123 [Russula aff. rugulosa BPL654]
MNEDMCRRERESVCTRRGQQVHVNACAGRRDRGETHAQERKKKRLDSELKRHLMSDDPPR